MSSTTNEESPALAKRGTMITLYDIPSQHPEVAWSPNTLKTRIALNYKQLPFKTEWVEYPDIEPLMKQLGALPTSKKKDGSDFYTLPVIFDSLTGRYISDSKDIATYLDETYPDTPPIYPTGSRAAIELFRISIWDAVAEPFRPLIVLPACMNLNPRSQEYFRRTREASFKCKLEDVAPPGPVREEHWTKMKEGCNVLERCLAKNGPNAPYFLGDTFSFADAVAISYMLWVKRVLRDNEEWKPVEKWHDGRWARLLEDTKELYTVHD